MRIPTLRPRLRVAVSTATPRATDTRDMVRLTVSTSTSLTLIDILLTPDSLTIISASSTRDVPLIVLRTSRISFLRGCFRK